MVDYSISVQEAYHQRQSRIIIGLTGRTGSGCSTVAGILQVGTFRELNLPTPKDHDFKNETERKYAVTYKYMMEDGRWFPFQVIHASGIIFTYILDGGFAKFSDFISKIQKSTNLLIPSSENLSKDVEQLKYCFEQYENFKAKHFYTVGENPDNIGVFLEKVKKDKTYGRSRLEIAKELMLKKVPTWKGAFEQALRNHSIIAISSDGNHEVRNAAYVYIMQTIGNNIRCSGEPYSSENSQNHFYDVAKRIDLLISIICEAAEQSENAPPVRVCIDAIRNVYEAFFFKDRYSYFYLVSVNTDDSERKNRLKRLNQEELDGLDQTELSKNDSSKGSLFYHQNMNECLSISDIHLYNPKENMTGGYPFLTEQILKYLCLMLHPGLIAPTAVERCMQTAYVAKLNSGCLSRQVGAVVTDQDYSIKAIGWNNTPKGQVPCNLRCVKDYIKNQDVESFSEFELEDPELHKALCMINNAASEKKLKGLANVYCFKDVYNAINKNSNQVYTRALHAEENAFLQISKYGGMGVRGGKLFSTASPCELCSKKAFQLGIEEIYYIDPYPGISTKHILHFGKTFRPGVHLFYGAIGNAYINLYTPRISPKDEIELLVGTSTKEILQKKDSKSMDAAGQMKLLKYETHTCSFRFHDRTHMEEIDEGTVEARKADAVRNLFFPASWTGDTGISFYLEKCDFTKVGEETDIKAIDVNRVGKEEQATSTFGGARESNYVVPLSRAIGKGEALSYKLRTMLTDLNCTMHPYYQVQVTNPTEIFEMSVFEPDDLFVHNSITVQVYAGNTTSEEYLLDEQYEIVSQVCTVEVLGRKISGKMHKIIIPNPKVMDIYCINWKFK